MEYIIYLIAGIAIGLSVGIFISAAALVRMNAGMLKTMYDDDEPYLFLDLDKYPEEIVEHKFVVFRVEQKPKSQK